MSTEGKGRGAAASAGRPPEPRHTPEGTTPPGGVRPHRTNRRASTGRTSPAREPAATSPRREPRAGSRSPRAEARASTPAPHRAPVTGGPPVAPPSRIHRRTSPAADGAGRRTGQAHRSGSRSRASSTGEHPRGEDPARDRRAPRRPSQPVRELPRGAFFRACSVLEAREHPAASTPPEGRASGNFPS